MKSTQCGWRSLAVAGLALLGIASAVSAADAARERKADSVPIAPRMAKPVGAANAAGAPSTEQDVIPNGKRPWGNVMGDPDLRGQDLKWVDTSFAPTQNLHPPKFEPCKSYLDAAKFDADNPGLAAFENYDSTVSGRRGAYIFGVGDWATSGNATGGCGLSDGWNVDDIVHGIEAREFPPTRGSSGIAQYGTGFQGATSNGVIANFFVDSWGVFFNDPIRVQIPPCPDNSSTPTAIRVAKVTSFFGADPNIRNHFTLVDGREKTLTGSSAPGGVFFGACCDAAIAKIDVFSPTNQGEGYDDIGFGAKTTCLLPELITLQDLHIGQEILGQMAEAIEGKLDGSGGGGGGGGGGSR